MGADTTTRGLLVVNFFQLFSTFRMGLNPPLLEDTQYSLYQKSLSIFNEWVICPFIENLQKGWGIFLENLQRMGGANSNQQQPKQQFLLVPATTATPVSPRNPTATKQQLLLVPAIQQPTTKTTSC